MNDKKDLEVVQEVRKLGKVNYTINKSEHKHSIIKCLILYTKITSSKLYIN